ncbi:MAG: helix-turn-helix transcriptional regulator [Pseudomonadota bacterium]
MGTKHNAPPPPRASLADALFPKVRQRILAVLFDAPERSFYMGEVIALAHSGTGAVQRELAGLAAAGILTVQKQGKQKHYQANVDAPVFNELRALVGKTMGVVNVLHASLDPLAGSISAAFVYDDSISASGAKPMAVTVVLFSANADSGAASDAMQGAANTLARQVSFTLYTPESLVSATAKDRNFMTRLLQAPKTWLLGSEDQLFGQPT